MSSPSIADSCKVLLYYQDQRASDSAWSDTTEVSFSKQTAKRANSTVCGYFNISQENDKKLFESIFYSDIDLNWFEFYKNDSPHIAYGVKILGNRNVVFIDDPQTFEALDKNGRLIRVKVMSLLGKNNYDLSLEDLRGHRRGDLSIVALNNSESFKRYIQNSDSLGFARFLEVIDPAKL